MASIDLKGASRRLAAIVVAGLATTVGAKATTLPSPPLITTWAASPDFAGPPLGPVTVRHLLRATAGGDGLALRLSNLFGTTPLRLGPVHVALPAAVPASGPAARGGSDRALTFHGAATVVIPPGGSVDSDVLAMPVAPLQDLLLTVHVPQRVAVSTVHGNGLDTVWLADGADATVAAAADFPRSATPDDSRYFVTALMVRPQAAVAARAHTVVALGDSITDGIASTPNAHARWPDVLARRVQAGDPAGAAAGGSARASAIAVVDAGIAGNRLLHDGADPYLGPSVLHRLDRDALDLPGVRTLVLLVGINDLTASDALKGPGQRVDADRMIAGLREVVQRAHARGVTVWGATLLPCGGAKGVLAPTPAAEAMRAAINAWIRTGHGFDHVLDLDAVLRDPAHPDRLLPAYDSGDHVHPNDAGYRAIGQAVDVGAL